MSSAPSLSYDVVLFDYAHCTAEDRSDIKAVYQSAFDNDLQLQFDAALDSDFVDPLKYYVPAVGGGYAVARREASGTFLGRRTIVGTVGIRRLPELHSTCELKRMFLASELRGRGIGVKLLTLILTEARRLGYAFVVLDTKQRLRAANKLYEMAGFVDCENYNGNPRADRFMRLDLSTILTRPKI